MQELPAEIPDVDAFLALEPEELASRMLFLMRRRVQGSFIATNLQNELWGSNSASSYAHRRAEVNLAFAEAWAWLEAQGLLVPADGTNGANGWRRLSRRALKIESAADFASFRSARLMPKEILHPKIADPVWRAFMRAEFDVAVFLAMKAVEVAVREASGLGDNLIGVKLMRAAFSVDGGPLTDMSVEPGERTARMELFAGAIGSYKNPHSHRDVNLSDPVEAMGAIYLANTLLRIVDQSRGGAGAAP